MTKKVASIYKTSRHPTFCVESEASQMINESKNTHDVKSQKQEDLKNNFTKFFEKI